MPFTLSNIKEDLEDIGPRFDGAPELEFPAATRALELALFAISSVEAPWNPRSANSTIAASRTSSRRSSALFRCSCTTTALCY